MMKVEEQEVKEARVDDRLVEVRTRESVFEKVADRR